MKYLILALALFISKASANDLLLAGVSRQPDVIADFVGQSTILNNNAPFNFSAVTIGPPVPDRTILVAFSTINGVSVNSATVNGNSMTPIGCVNLYFLHCFHYANVPSGTTASFAYATSAVASVNGAAIGVWVVKNVQSFVPVSSDASGGLSSTSTSASATVSTLRGGYVFGISGFRNTNSIVPNMSWAPSSLNYQGLTLNTAAIRIAASGSSVASNGASMTINSSTTATPIQGNAIYAISLR